jgi:hypothetical protein
VDNNLEFLIRLKEPLKGAISRRRIPNKWCWLLMAEERSKIISVRNDYPVHTPARKRPSSGTQVHKIFIHLLTPHLQILITSLVKTQEHIIKRKPVQNLKQSFLPEEA